MAASPTTVTTRVAIVGVIPVWRICIVKKVGWSTAKIWEEVNEREKLKKEESE